MKPGVIGIIQARLSSSRLPGKILCPLAGEPLLGLLVGRLASAQVDEWWLATSRERSDDVTAAWGESLGMRVQRGSVDDVLSRFTAIIRERQPNWIVRITADDPFVDGAIVNRLLGALPDAEKSASLVGYDGEVPVFPLGYGAQLARASAVVDSEDEIPDEESFHRSHVLTWLRVHGQNHSVSPPKNWPRRPDWRWTIDTELDLQMARRAFALFGSRAVEIGYCDMVDALDACPDIVAINRCVQQKEVSEG